MAAEAQRYADYAPKALEGAGTLLSAHAETVHVAARAYILAGVELGNTQALREVYANGAEKVLHTTLEHLLQQTLKTWHQNKRLRAEQDAFGRLYKERLGWHASAAEEEAFSVSVQALVHQIPTLGIPMEYTAETLTIRLAGQLLSYPNPTAALQQPCTLSQPVLVMNTPGVLTGDNILTDASSQTWLTDFADAGLAPQVWNMVALEAAIRFDWVEVHDLQALHRMESCLLKHSLSKSDMHDADPALRKALQAIHSVRQLATSIIETDLLSYSFGLLFQALHRLLALQPTVPLTTHELVRYAHVLLAAAMLYGKIQQHAQDSANQQVPVMTGLQVDEANRTVWVNGERKAVPGQSYDLLLYLYQRTGQLCTRQQLVEKVLGLSYDEDDVSQVNRLNTAIRRLRERIEEDTSQPRYLHTESGHGYRLVHQPTLPA